MNRRAFALLGLSGLSGCAPLMQKPLTPNAAFLGPRIEPDAIISFDGAKLPLTVWPAAEEGGGDAAPWAVMVALHGMDDYAQAWVVAAPFWAAHGVTTYAYDQRGFGRGAQRGVWAGDALFEEDLRTACALVRRRHPDALLGVVGESMGGAAAITAFASPKPPDADRLLLLSPAVWGWSEQPAANRLALWIAAHSDPAGALEAPAWVYRRHQSTDNIAILRRMGADRNMIFKTRVDATYGLVNLMQEASASIGRIAVPTLYAYGLHDNLIPRKAAFHAASRLPASDRSAYYRDGWHLLNRDLHADVVLRDVLAFMRDPQAALPSGAPPIPGRRT